MRVALLVVGSVAFAVVVWASVGSSVAALIGGAGWFALIALAWPALVYVGARRYGDS